jgi:hypothetical protein
VRVWQPEGNDKIMKKREDSKGSGKESDEMLPEYRLDYSKARPNRFASRILEEGVTIILDPDVSEVFATSESVNTVLRALIETMPRTKGRKRTCKQSPKQVGG